jgi:hypothetical protein
MHGELGHDPIIILGQVLRGLIFSCTGSQYQGTVTNFADFLIGIYFGYKMSHMPVHGFDIRV